MVNLVCSMMKFRIYHGMLVCTVLLILLLCWISFSAFLCWLSQTVTSDSYLRPLTNRFCPSSSHVSGNTVSSFSHPHKTLGLVSELLKDEYESQVASTLTRSTCQQPESLSKTGITLDEVPISCVPLCPSVKTCHKSNQKEVVCDQKQHVVCELKVNSALPTVPDIVCHEICQSQVQIGVFNNTVGYLTWNTVSTVTKLQSYILHLINPLVTAQDSSGFCFIQCILKDTNQTVTQLLVLPPNLNYLNKFKKQDIHPDRQQHSAINFNLVLLEGVTRYGFWNKLPLSTEKLKVVQNSDVKVLDFETVQSSASALLWEQVTGVSADSVFKAATSNGYQTLWLEDGCYQESISTNFSRLVSWMSQASVLDVGPSVAFCEARSWNSWEMPCYNGIAWHDYSFKYLRYYKAVLGKFGQPYISVFHSHLGNDHLHVASLDQSLAKEIQFFANQKNTLTVIISYPMLGGFAYPKYVLDGAPVVFHPVMFILIPKSIQQFSEQSEFLSNLIVNQNRFVTTLDLYELIKYVISGGQPDQTAHMSSSEHLGLLAQIPVVRSCEDIFLESSAACVCERYQVPVKTGKHITLLAEYAVSELNAILQRQFVAGMLYLKDIGYQDHVISTCQRLIGDKVYNVSQALIQNDRVLTEMTIEMKSGITTPSSMTNHSSHVSAFRVTIEHNAFINASSLSLAMKLISYKRLDNYVMYEVCTGGLINVDLCLCQPSADNITAYPINRTLLDQMSILKSGKKWLRDVYKYFDPNLLITTLFYQFGSRTMTHSLDPNAKEQCLFIVYRMHDIGANFEAVNICNDHAYDLGFSIRGKNLCYSNSLAITHQVAPLSVVHLVTVLQNKTDENWFLRYQAQFREFLL